MKKISILLLFGCCLMFTAANAQFGGFLGKLRDKTTDKVSDKVSDKLSDDAANSLDKKNSSNSSSNSNNNSSSSSGSNGSSSSSSGTTAAAPAPALPTLNTYKTYDFVPGDSIIFADNFSDDQVGEYPSHWLSCYGQGQVNAFDGKMVFMCTQGSHGDGATVLEPRMKKRSGYMPSAFTVEFDMYCNCAKGSDYDDSWAGINLYGDDELIDGYDDLDIGPGELGFGTHEIYGDNLTLPDSIAEGNFINKWHHVAIAYRNGQMKIYLDQNRIYVIPQVLDTNFTKFGIRVAGKCVVTNIRVAKGGGMVMIKKKFTAAKIVTHGITFDVGKATIKPESMGTLNMIMKVMNNNPTLKFEIDGYTDSTGTEAGNLTLSQQRADAIKTQLVSMGIDASRLTTKGFGDTHPLSDNSTAQGRANNRRVEFVRM